MNRRAVKVEAERLKELPSGGWTSGTWSCYVDGIQGGQHHVICDMGVDSGGHKRFWACARAPVRTPRSPPRHSRTGLETPEEVHPEVAERIDRIAEALNRG